MASGAVAQTSRVFVTSTTSDGNLGGLAGADMTCNSLAATAGLGGNWVAWLSTSTVDAKDRLPPGSGPFVRAVNTGVVIANDIPDLLDDLLENSISEDEFGTNRDGEDVWTGTRNDGTVGINLPAFSTCSDWVSNVPGDFALVGNAEDTLGEWTHRGGQGCEDPTLRTYCFDFDSIFSDGFESGDP